MEDSESVTNDAPRFSFGEMALAEEPGRVQLSAVGANCDVVAGGSEASRRTSGTADFDTNVSYVLNRAVARLRKILRNEEGAPEILQYESATVHEMQRLISAQTEVVDENEDVSTSLESHLQRLEIDRLNYMLRSYFRIRIKKIEESVLFIFNDEEVYDRLSLQEQKFGTTYMDLVENHFDKSFLSMLPERLRILDKDGNVDHATPPELDKFVFCRVLKMIGQYVVSDEPNDEPFDLVKDDIICIRYGSVRKLLVVGDAELL